MLFLSNSFVSTLRIPYGKAISNSPKNPRDCIILDNRVFENFILADEPFAKALQIF